MLWTWADSAAAAGFGPAVLAGWRQYFFHFAVGPSWVGRSAQAVHGCTECGVTVLSMHSVSFPTKGKPHKRTGLRAWGSGNRQQVCAMFAPHGRWLTTRSRPLDARSVAVSLRGWWRWLGWTVCFDCVARADRGSLCVFPHPFVVGCTWCRGIWGVHTHASKLSLWACARRRSGAVGRRPATRCTRDCGGGGRGAGSRCVGDLSPVGANPVG